MLLQPPSTILHQKGDTPEADELPQNHRSPTCALTLIAEEFGDLHTQVIEADSLGDALDSFTMISSYVTEKQIGEILMDLNNPYWVHKCPYLHHTHQPWFEQMAWKLWLQKNEIKEKYKTTLEAALLFSTKKYGTDDFVTYWCQAMCDSFAAAEKAAEEAAQAAAAAEAATTTKQAEQTKATVEPSKESLSSEMELDDPVES